MSDKRDIQPGTFESVAGVEIGTFVLNEWTHFELGDDYKYLVSDVVIKLGGATVPGSAYELAVDSAATAQEVGKTDKTLHGMIKIVNITYVGVVLNFTGSNFGGYNSNDSINKILTAGLLTKMEPGTDAYIDEGEKAVFNSTSGIQVVSDNSGELAKWDSGTVYSVAGTLVRLEGMTFSATGQASNQNKNPLNPNNGLYWYMPQEANNLLMHANRGTVIPGDMHTTHDYSSSNYLSSLKIGGKELNGVQQEFYLIHLDGTQVTGNTVLENLLGVGGDEYLYIDEYAPDVVGTRTLIDMRERSTRAMGAGGGNAPTLAEIQDDAMQRITGDFESAVHLGSSGVFSPGSAGNPISGSPQAQVKMSFDSADSISPSTAKTNDSETRIKALVRGVDYIVVMVEQ